MTEELNPVQVEKQILTLVKTLSSALTEWRKVYRSFKEAERKFDAAYAEARIAVDKDVPYNDRKYYADIATMKEREQKDLAQESFKYAEERLQAIRHALSSWQTISKSVQQAYGFGGRGEG